MLFIELCWWAEAEVQLINITTLSVVSRPVLILLSLLINIFQPTASPRGGAGRWNLSAAAAAGGQTEGGEGNCEDGREHSG